MPKKKDDKAEPALRQINIRVAQSVHDRVAATAEALGLDPAQLVRMIIKVHLPHYERQAEAVRKGEPPPTASDA